MKNENLKKKSKSREIIEDILSEIEQSNIKIGDKLPSERSLAEKYNVSRIVIREVISYLKAIGVVESVQGSGNYVKDYPKQEYFDLNYLDYDVDDLLESRKILGFDVISESILVHDSGGFFIVNVCINVPEDRSNEFFELVKEGTCTLSSIYLM